VIAAGLAVLLLLSLALAQMERDLVSLVLSFFLR